MTIKSFKFAPDPITVDVGGSVTWTNADPVGHTVTARDNSFKTGMFFPMKAQRSLSTRRGHSRISAVPTPRCPGQSSWSQPIGTHLGFTVRLRSFEIVEVDLRLLHHAGTG